MNPSNYRKKTNILPQAFKIYFWDVDWDDLQQNTRKFRDFITCRLTDKGDEDAIRWLRRQLQIKDINAIVQKNRSVSLKTKLFWKHWAENV